MTDTKQSPPRTGVNPEIVGAIQVTLEALLGEARVTVAELTALKSGATLALTAPLNHPVELRLNGAVVARGELVAVGDHFAVRLTDVSGAAE
ncbi:MAG: FliM/FliN family flagellar motor switch protein [Sphingomonas sp.]|nr:FliM/FliN family flagellar motor switch protein [Sphingomonas sp.]